MKNVTITSLSRPILVVELSEGLSQMRKNTLFILNRDGWVLLGKPDEISEEDAAELIPMHYDYAKTAVEYIIEVLESEIYWDVNPFESKADSLVSDNSANGCALYRKAFHEFCEAQDKTFDKQRTFIFVKN